MTKINILVVHTKLTFNLVYNGLKEIKGIGEVQAKRIEELLTKIVIITSFSPYKL